MSITRRIISRLGKTFPRFSGEKNHTTLKSANGGSDVDCVASLSLRETVLLERQAVLYRSLVSALSTDAVVFAKVRLADFLKLDNGGNDLKFAIKMDRKFVDFLLCDPQTMKPLAVVEMSSSPTKSDSRSQTKDPFVMQSLRSAKVKLLRIEARSHYAIDELRTLLLDKIVDPDSIPPNCQAASVSHDDSLAVPDQQTRFAHAGSSTQVDQPHVDRPHADRPSAKQRRVAAPR